jgi:hypothetical protein
MIKSEVKKCCPSVQYFYAIVIALALVCLIKARTNEMSQPLWDGAYYVDMAANGIVGNPNLVAPFAYRPGMPLISGMIADLFLVSTEDGFRIVVFASSVLFLLSIFALTREFTNDFRHALLTMVILGLSSTHVKIPLFFFTLVDVFAYFLIVLAFHAMIKKRLNLCLIISSIGLFFKEFLAIPLFIVILIKGYRFVKSRSTKDIVDFTVSMGIGLAVIGIPRIFIRVSHTDQFLDPLNDIRTLKILISAPLDEARVFNIIHGMFGYWLPTFCLLTRQRFIRVWTELGDIKLKVMSIYLLLVLFLSLYGGVNILVFVGYSVVAQAIVLTLLFRRGVRKVEIIYVVCVLILYNKILLHVPQPQICFDTYLDFFGTAGSRVTVTTLMRFTLMCVYIYLASVIRYFVAGVSVDKRSMI